MRLFVMIDVPESWRRAARSAQSALVAGLPEGTLRPVGEAQLHLTLRFLGEVEESALPALARELSRLAPLELTLRLGGAGSFGGPRRARICWLAVESDGGALDALAGRVEVAVVAAGAPARGEPFHAHLTLARVTRRADAAARLAVWEAVGALAEVRAPPFRAREFALVRSHLEGSGGYGPRYEPLERFR